MPFGLAKKTGRRHHFSLGLMLVVVSGADLFTSTVLIVIAKASGRQLGPAGRQLAERLSRPSGRRAVLRGADLVLRPGEYMVANGQWGLNVPQTADHKEAASHLYRSRVPRHSG
ncbi:hypothetical protein M8494_16465 [Serratia ureilytica]